MKTSWKESGVHILMYTMIIFFITVVAAIFITEALGLVVEAPGTLC
jgi:hypothetical protein